ncbi:MAG TPA: hypothetical protein VHM48_00115 [Candidatus Limnocylindrales bacterium]|nr:hypothetical protein [Candidatus Limnocylindrales bacterium]
MTTTTTRAGPEEPAGRPSAAGSAARLTVRPPAWLDRALEVAIVATKTATIACAIDGFVNADTPRLRGKAIRTRAIGYTAALFIVPSIWRLMPERGRYPRGLDLAVTLPLLIDAGGNALGLYEEAHLDDVVHFLNSAIVSGVAGSLFGTRTDEPWQAALAGTGTAIAGETVWEITEFLAMKAGADGMDLTYADTMADLTESALGAVVGGIVTWLRMPRDRAERRQGWRHAVAGWRRAGEPVALIAGRGPAAEPATASTG